MAEVSKKVRGASYPVIDLEKSVSLARNMLDAVGKASASKLDVAKAVGYSGINGKSKRVIAALIQYGLITGRAAEHKLTDLALQILFPEDEKYKNQAIKQAALKPTLFNTLVSKYEGDVMPTMLPNILVTSHGINPSSADEAAIIFRSTLQYAGLLDSSNRIFAEGVNENTQDSTDMSDVESSNTSQLGGIRENTSNLTSPPDLQSGHDLNRIEIVLREGVKAGIYAPHNLNEDEKDKLKKIIDLL